MDAFAISRLAEQPRFLSVVADRVWNAWWRAGGHPLSQIEERLQECFAAETTPMTLVAHDGARFLGTVSLIECDMEVRPQYAPWVAALWVEPKHRTKGIGAALVRAVAEVAFGFGRDPVYLCATPANATFYLKRGWQRIESGVAGLDILSLSQR